MRPRLRWKSGGVFRRAEVVPRLPACGSPFRGVVPGGGSKTRAWLLTERRPLGLERLSAHRSEWCLEGGCPRVGPRKVPFDGHRSRAVGVPSQRRSFLRVVTAGEFCGRGFVKARRSLDVRAEVGSRGRAIALAGRAEREFMPLPPRRGGPLYRGGLKVDAFLADDRVGFVSGGSVAAGTVTERVSRQEHRSTGPWCWNASFRLRSVATGKRCIRAEPPDGVHLRRECRSRCRSRLRASWYTDDRATVVEVLEGVVPVEVKALCRLTVLRAPAS